MRFTNFCLVSSAFAGEDVKSSGGSPTAALKNPLDINPNDVSNMAENPDQIIQDQLYWCCRDNKSLSSCANDVVRTLNSYLFGDFACSVTNTSPAYAWKTYEGIVFLIFCDIISHSFWAAYKSIKRFSRYVRLLPLYELRP